MICSDCDVLISCHWLWYDITTADAPMYERGGNSGTSTFRAQVLLKLVKTCSNRLIFLTNKFQQCCVISILLRCEGSHRPRKCQIKVPEDKNSNQANLRLRPFWVQCLWYYVDRACDKMFAHTNKHVHSTQTCKHKRYYHMHQFLCIKTGINVCMMGVCSSWQQHENNRVMSLLCQPQRSRVMFTTISNFKAFPVLTDKSCLSTKLTSEDIIDCNWAALSLWCLTPL